MVHLIANISDLMAKKKKEILQQSSIDSLVLKYLEYKYFSNAIDSINLNHFQAEEKVAAWGYMDGKDDVKEIQEELQIIIGKKEIKPGMHYSTKPILLAGLILTAKKLRDKSIGLLEEKALNNIKTFTLFEQFLLLSVLDKDQGKIYQGNIEQENIWNLLSLYALKNITPKSIEIEINAIRNEIIKKLSFLLTSINLSYKELFLFEFFSGNELKYSFRYEQDDAISIIRKILKSFNDAVSKITNERRKNHPKFTIIDEYDVQDLLYVILKPLFPDLTPEDPTRKYGGTSKRIDLVIPSQNITIEVKMLKEKDNEEKFIEELNVDISSYHTYPNMKYLFGFVYDPYHRIRDPYKFYQLDGEKRNNGVDYTVEIIINPR